MQLHEISYINRHRDPFIAQSLWLRISLQDLRLSRRAAATRGLTVVQGRKGAYMRKYMNAAGLIERAIYG